MKKGEEDYLRTIYELYSKSGVKSVEIASKLGISKASVSEMLRKLENAGLVKIHPYSPIFLTKKGKEEAEKITRKHEIIEKFVEKLGHKKPHDEAHKLEHSFSQEMIEKISGLIEGKIQKIERMPSYIS